MGTKIRGLVSFFLLISLFAFGGPGQENNGSGRVMAVIAVIADFCGWLCARDCAEDTNLHHISHCHCSYS